MVVIVQKTSTRSQIKSKVLAMIFGILVSIVLIFLLEFLAQLNNSYRWLKFTGRTQEQHAGISSLSGLEVPFLKGLSPAEKNFDIHIPGDYDEAYKHFKCKNPKYNSFWIGSENCSSEITLKKKGTGRVVYHTYYSFGKNGLRTVPAADPNSPKVFLFLGCSFTFGEGVADSETFPNQLTLKAGPANSFILATPGIGPHRVLQLLNFETDVRVPNITADRGIAIYTLLYDHIDRAFNTTSWIGKHNRHSIDDPSYNWVDGKFVYQGTFAEVRPFNFLYSIVARSDLADFFQISFPQKNRNLYARYAELFKTMKDRVRERFGLKNFVVAVYPGQKFGMPQELYQELTDRGIDVIDLSPFPISALAKGHHILNGDGHPSPIGYKIYTEVLFRELNNRGLL